MQCFRISTVGIAAFVLLASTANASCPPKKHKPCLNPRGDRGSVTGPTIMPRPEQYFSKEEYGAAMSAYRRMLDRSLTTGKISQSAHSAKVIEIDKAMSSSHH